MPDDLIDFLISADVNRAFSPAALTQSSRASNYHFQHMHELGFMVIDDYVAYLQKTPSERSWYEQQLALPQPPPNSERAYFNYLANHPFGGDLKAGYFGLTEEEASALRDSLISRPDIREGTAVWTAQEPWAEFVFDSKTITFNFQTQRRPAIALTLKVRPELFQRKIWFNTEFNSPPSRIISAQLVGRFQSQTKLVIPYEYQLGTKVSVRFDCAQNMGNFTGTSDEEVFYWTAPNTGQKLATSMHRVCTALDTIVLEIFSTSIVGVHNLGVFLAAYSEFPY